MPIPPLNLDDRKFADLVEELRGLIPRYASSWTDHNISDPGIMLIELFAWLAEAQLFRLNRISEASRVRLLELLGAVFKPAQPTIIKLSVSAEALQQPWMVKRGTQIKVRAGQNLAVINFEALEDVMLTPAAPQAAVPARQTEQVDKEVLGISNGGKCQLFELAAHFIALPKQPSPRHPRVWVDGEPWEFRASLSTSQPGDKHFTVRPALNAIVFGDGDKHGQIPTAGLEVTASYRTALAAHERIRPRATGPQPGHKGASVPFEQAILDTRFARTGRPGARIVGGRSTLGILPEFSGYGQRWT